MIGQALRLAVRSLLCVPLRVEWSAAAAGLSLLFHPLVGLVVGAVLVGLSGLLAGGDLLAAALLVAAWVLLTGGRPLAGLARSADAWAAGRGDRERSLRILRDPHTGAAGTISLVLLLGLKWSAVTGLMAQGQWQPLLLAPVLGQLALLGLCFTTPWAGGEPAWRTRVAHLPRREAARVLLLGVALVAFGSGRAAVWVLLAGFIAFALLRAMMVGRLGGATRHTAGAMVELIEAAVLATFVIA